MLWNIPTLLTFYVALILGSCILTISVQNPIHSILMLIASFIMGSLILILLALDYFALLFLIVYVGAIVVLFLFIVMMLELKMVNTAEKFSDLFNYRNLILPSLLVELLVLEQADGLSGMVEVTSTQEPVFAELNLYVDYSNIFIQDDVLTALGLVLFSYEKVGILLAALLLFVSMVGSIVLTMDTREVIAIKTQDTQNQPLRT